MRDALLVALAVDLLGARQQRLDATEVDEHVVAVAGLLDDAGHDLALAIDVLLVHDRALGLADALLDHLLGGHRGDAAEAVGRHVRARHLRRRAPATSRGRGRRRRPACAAARPSPPRCARARRSPARVPRRAAAPRGRRGSRSRTRGTRLRRRGSTSACRTAPGVFLYAARSASSSAATSVPVSMPFSRSIVRMPSMISWLMAPTYPSSITLPRTIASYGMSSDSSPTASEKLRSSGGDDLAGEPLLAGDGRRRANLDAPADGGAKVLGLAQRALRARATTRRSCSCAGSRRAPRVTRAQRS